MLEHTTRIIEPRVTESAVVMVRVSRSEKSVRLHARQREGKGGAPDELTRSGDETRREQEWEKAKRDQKKSNEKKK